MVDIETVRSTRRQLPMDHAPEIRQAGHQHHRRLADAHENPLRGGIGDAPPRPTWQIDHTLAAILQVEGVQCRTLAVVTDAGRDAEACALDDRYAVRPPSAFEDALRFISRGIEPRHACAAAVGGEDLSIVGDRSGDARKSRQRRDVSPRVVVDHLDAIARGVRDEHAARPGIERCVVKLAIESVGDLDDAKIFHAQSPRKPSVAQSLDCRLAGSLRIPVCSD
jgi:hypothetical protein